MLNDFKLSDNINTWGSEIIEVIAIKFWDKEKIKVKLLEIRIFYIWIIGIKKRKVKFIFWREWFLKKLFSPESERERRFQTK
jgi:hypothetical protein